MNISNPRSVLCFFAFTLFLPFAAVAQQPGEEPKRVKSGSWQGKEIQYVAQEILVKPKSGKLSQKVNALFDRRNISITHRFEIGWAQVKIPKKKNVFKMINALEASPLVVAAEPNTVGHYHLLPDDPYFQGDSPASVARQWGLNNTGQSPPGGTSVADINATAAWNESTGSSSTVIAVLDSGIPMTNQDGDWDSDDLSHEDLDDPNKIIVGPDYSNDNDKGIRDEVGHGTHVAGIAAAETDNDTGIAGVSWGSKLLAIQVGSDDPHPPTRASFEKGVEYAVDYANNNNLNLVINASLGWNNGSMALKEGVQYANDNGVPLVVGVGNALDQEGEDDGTDCNVHYPAAYASSYSNVIAVASTDHNDNWSQDYSCTGSEINVAAPGGFGGQSADADDVYSTIPDYPGTVIFGSNTDYGYHFGTSMAAPYVAGTAALMLSETPSLTPSELRSTLESTAENVNGGNQVDNEIGHGRINANRAVEKLTPPSSPDQFEIANAGVGQGGEHPKLEWNAPLFVDSYNLYRRDPERDSTYQKIASVGGGTTSYTDTEITLAHLPPDPGWGEIFYRIKAVNEHGTSKAAQDGGALYDPSSSYATDRPRLSGLLHGVEARATGTSAALEWTARPDAISSGGFRVQHRADSTGAWNRLGTVGTADSVATDTTAGARYRFESPRPLEVGAHQFRLVYDGAAGTERHSQVVTAAIEMKEAYRLSAYPNPVEDRATVALAVKERQRVQVRIYDMLGRRVTTLYDGPLAEQETKRLALRPSAAGLASGAYFVRVKGEGFVATERLTVVR